MAREFSYSIYDNIVKGLSPDSRFPINGDYCEELFNAKAHAKWGIVPYVPVNMAITTGPSLAFPFPHLIKLREKTYLFDATSFQEVDESTWAVTNQTINKAHGGGVATITTGSIWQVLDFGDAFMFHNGAGTIFKTGLNKALGLTEQFLYQNNVKINAGTTFKGRTWTGGFATSIDSQWINLIQAQAKSLPSIILETLESLKSNSVMWSSIGGGDLLWLFYPTLGQQGILNEGYFEDKLELFRDILEKNEMGSRRMPWQGSVRMMKQLGDAVIVYGDSGVTALIPHGVEVELRDLNIPDGINNVGALDGDEKEHIWIDKRGVLWRLSGDLQAQRLGYDNHFSNLTSGTLIISFDANEREYYIDNGTKHFILSSGGLSEHGQTVTSVINTLGGVYGYGVAAASMSDKEFRLTSNIYDESRSGKKWLSQVDASVSGNTNMFARTSARNDRTGSFTVTREIAINREGVARVNINANEHKIKLRTVDYSVTNLDDVRVHWQSGDTRFQRGIQEGIDR